MKYSKILLIVMLVVCIFITYIRFIDLKTENDAHVQSLTALYAERVQVAVQEAAGVTEVLSSVTMLYSGAIPVDELDVLMQLAYDKDIHLAIAYMPNGVIEKTYPLKGNEASIGYNVFEDKAARPDAVKAMETRSIVFSGPYLLMTGVTGLVSRKPIFVEQDGEEVFWGFVAAIIRPDEGFLKGTGLLDLDKLGYEYRLSSSYSGNTVELYKSQGFDGRQELSDYVFEVGQSKWSISICQTNAQMEIIQNVCFFALALIAVSILIFLAFRRIEIQQQNSYEQSLTDPLTKLRNRRALDLYIKDISKFEDKGFTVFFLDLNKFKPVNDNFGHDVGDTLLQTFAERLMSNFKKTTFIARIGGDEFIVIFPEAHSEEKCIHFSERFLALSEDMFLIGGKEIKVSSSIGYAAYPRDGDSFADVLAKADHAMFEYKELYRKGR